MKEAASVTWRAVRQWRRGWGTFCDKGIAVKSERAEGVSVGDPQWSSSPVAPLPPPREWHRDTQRPHGSLLPLPNCGCSKHHHSAVNYQTAISDRPQCALLMLGDKAHGRSHSYSANSLISAFCALFCGKPLAVLLMQPRISELLWTRWVTVEVFLM